MPAEVGRAFRALQESKARVTDAFANRPRRASLLAAPTPKLAPATVLRWALDLHCEQPELHVAASAAPGQRTLARRRAAVMTASASAAGAAGGAGAGAGAKLSASPATGAPVVVRPTLRAPLGTHAAVVAAYSSARTFEHAFEWLNMLKVRAAPAAPCRAAADPCRCRLPHARPRHAVARNARDGAALCVRHYGGGQCAGPVTRRARPQRDGARRPGALRPHAQRAAARLPPGITAPHAGDADAAPAHAAPVPRPAPPPRHARAQRAGRAGGRAGAA